MAPVERPEDVKVKPAGRKSPPPYAARLKAIEASLLELRANGAEMREGIKRLSDAEAEARLLTKAVDGLQRSMEKVVADSDAGRALLANMMDIYLKDRVLTWVKVALMFLAATYNLWWPVFFSHGVAHG